jgi:TatD DNase family protein
MNLPKPGEYINIHTHGTKPAEGIFEIENLMANEWRTPYHIPEQACTFGIHPWYLDEKNCDQLLYNVNAVSGYSNLVAIGEAGFDKVRGPSIELQRKAFVGQIEISEDIKKPVFIHCVRAWDELLPEFKKLKPKMPWLIHGFRGNAQLAKQLISKGIYLSFWFDFVIRPEAGDLLRSLPTDRIFLETDGADVDIRDIYNKVSNDLDIPVKELQSIILSNFYNYFNLKTLKTE